MQRTLPKFLRFAGINAALLSLSLLAGCANVTGSTTDGDWYRFETDHLRVIGRVSPSRLQVLVRDLDYFRQFLVMSGIARWQEATTPITIVVVDSATTFRALNQRRFVAGWYQSSLRGSFAVVNLDSFLRDNAGRNVLFHEYSHFLTAQNEGFRYPRWYSEGLAEYFSTFRVGDEGELVIGEPLTYRVKSQVFELLSLPTLLLKTERLLGRPEPLSYSDAWLLVHYFSATPHRQQQLLDYLTRYDEGHSLKQAYDDAFDMDMAGLHDEVTTYFREGRFQFRRIPIESVAETDDYILTRLTQNEVKLELGRLYVGIEESHNAKRFFHQVSIAEPDNAEAYAGLAAVALETGAFADAEPLAAQALQLDAGNSWALITRARLRRAQAASQTDANAADLLITEARGMLSRAIERSPRLPDAYREMAMTFPDLDERSHWLAQAAALQPLNHLILLDRARTWISQGNMTEARTTLEYVIVRSDSDVRQQARRMLAELPAPE